MEAAASPADTNQPAAGDGTGWEMRYRKVMDRLKAPKDESTLSLERFVLVCFSGRQKKQQHFFSPWESTMKCIHQQIFHGNCQGPIPA